MKRALTVMIAILTLLSLTTIAFGAAEPFTVVNAQELRTMMDQNDAALVVIDSRNAGEYDEAHIRGAVSLPYSLMAANQSLLNVPKTSKIAFYCSGST